VTISCDKDVQKAYNAQDTL